MSRPTGWKSTTLSEFLELQRGFDLPSHKRTPGKYKVLSSGRASGSHNEGPVKGPGFVIGRATNLGRPTWSDDDYWPLNTVLFVKNFRGNDPKFAYYVFENLDLSGYNSGSVQPMLNRNYIANVEIGVPEAAEQHRIGATLGALDDKVESNRHARVLIESLVRAHFERLFDVSFDEAGVPISSVVNVNPRRLLSRGSSATYVGMASLPEFAAEIDNWETRNFGSGQKFVNGDVLMARITPCLENGKTAVVDMLTNSEVGWGSTEFIVLAPKGSVTTPWIYCLARDSEVRDYAIRSMTGTSGRQRFQAGNFDSYKIKPPSESELADFNEIALPLFERLTQMRNENLVLAGLRDTLLRELLAGHIRVPGPPEVAEATP